MEFSHCGFIWENPLCIHAALTLTQMQIDFLRLSGVGLAIKVTVVLKITVVPIGVGGRGIHTCS